MNGHGKHVAPKVEFCEVLRDALQAALDAGSIADFWELISPELSQAGLRAPAEMPTGGPAIGAYCIEIAKGEQRRYRERVEDAREHWRLQKSGHPKEFRENSKRIPKEFREKRVAPVTDTDTDTGIGSSSSCARKGAQLQPQQPQQQFFKSGKDAADSTLAENPPTIAEVADALRREAGARGVTIDAEAEARKLIAYNEARGWKMGHAPLRNLGGVVRSWLFNIKAEPNRESEPESHFICP